MVAAAVLALRCYDSNLYDKHFYQPVIRFLIKHKIIAPTRSFLGRRQYSNTFTQYKWSVGSNRLPYIVKSVKNFFKKFNK